MSENWLPVPGYETLYQVSDHGRIRSLRSGKLMKLTPERQTRRRTTTYPIVTLTKAPRQQRCYKVHTLVLTTFRGPRPPGQEARHYDGNSHNNHLTNLLWGTPYENGQDRVRYQTHCKHGHEFTDENTWIHTPRDGHQRRYCNECRRIRLRELYRRKTQQGDSLTPKAV